LTGFAVSATLPRHAHNNRRASTAMNQDFLATALEAAKAAADVIRRHYGREIEIELKADATPVTVADVAAEQAIRGLLTGRFPSHGFYGEETGRRGEDAEFLWLVDPIDGTKAFVRGYPFFSTQIALMQRGRLILGVSSAPIYGELAWAVAGEGAWLDGNPLRVSRVGRLQEAAVSSGNLQSLARDRRWQAYGEIVAAANRIRGYGDFLHYHLLAAGKIDAVIESDVNILDIAALAVIVEAAGGRFTDLEGRPVGLMTTTVLATNGLLHEALIDKLQSGGP
jgi:histidinol-phosphatase